MRLSVVIPTRSRMEKLRRVLDALESQRGDVSGGTEIVVVDDASSDGTPGLLAERAAAGRIRTGASTGKGPGLARNVGVRAASGDVVLFLGDDILPEPGFLAAHDRAHREAPGPRAVLGYTGWDRSRMRITPLVAHLGERGLQFGYGLITDPENVPFNFFYASNVSLPRDVFLSLGGFDETFPFAAWEDVEFAWRAMRAPRPLRLVYRPGARAAHDHPVSLSSFRERQRRSGLAAAVFARKHPESGAFLGVDEAKRVSARRPAALAILGAAIETLDPLGVRLPPAVYDKVLRWDYLSSLKQALGEALPSGERDATGGEHEAEALH